jgi:universal stress protein E
MEIKNILLAVDFADTMDSAIATAGYLAAKFNAEVTPLRVVEEVVEYPFFHFDDMKLINDHVSSRIDELVKTLTGKGLTVNRSFIQEGKPVYQILSTADILDIDLIVMGAARKNMVERLFGAVAEKIVRSANQPVLLVHPEGPLKEIKNIVCSAASECTLQAAISICRLLDSTLHIVHAFPDPTPHFEEYDALTRLPYWGGDDVVDFDSDYANTERIICGESSSFKEFLKKFDLSNLKYQDLIRHGSPADRIFETVEDTDCDLLIMGAVDRKDKPYFFSKGTIEQLLRSLPCSLLTIKHCVEHDRKMSKEAPEFMKNTVTSNNI